MSTKHERLGNSVFIARDQANLEDYPLNYDCAGLFASGSGIGRE
jgi:hypothetical protein